MFTAPEGEQVFIFVPAIAVAAVINVRVLVEVELVQPGFEAVSVNVILPADMSAALGL